jgi:hypothetical protein
MRRVLQLACVLFVITGSGVLYADGVWLVPITDPSSIGRYLLRNEAVQQELHIDAAQWPAIQKVLDQWQLVLPDLDALSPEERDKKIDELLHNADLSISTEDALARALTPEQQTRLNQLLLQRVGIGAFLLVSISQRLEFTDEQKQKVRETLRQPLTRPTETREQRLKGVLDLLTPAQQEKWQQLIGPKFEVQGALTGSERRGLQGSRPTLLVFEEVRRELGITEDQMRRIRIQWGKIQAEMPAFKFRISAEEQNSRAAAAEKDRRQLNLIADRALSRVLSPEQQRRFHELELQRRGSWAFRDSAIADQLGLSEAQRKRVAELTVSPERPSPRSFRLTDEERRANQEKDEQTKARLVELLTPVQRTAWEKLLGPKFDFAFLQGRPEAAAFDRDR